MRGCECEHESHFGSHSAHATRHQYGSQAEGDLTEFKTIYGSYSVCAACIKDHPYPADLLQRMDERLKNIPPVDPRIRAIRSHLQLGVGSCSAVDECIEDSELLRTFAMSALETPEQAVEYYLRLEGIYNEVEDDIRGAGNVSPLHSPRIPGHVYDDDAEDSDTQVDSTQSDTGFQAFENLGHRLQDSTDLADENPYGPYDGSFEQELSMMDDEERHHRYGL